MDKAKEIPSRPGFVVDDVGNVYNKKGKLLSKWMANNGYFAVKCGYRHTLVHRAVAEAWLGFYDGMTVNHKDGNKKNNHVSNLEWMTNMDNVMHAFENGLVATPMIPIMGVNIENGDGLWIRSQSLSSRYGISPSGISKCINGHSKQHKGYEWSVFS